MRPGPTHDRGSEQTLRSWGPILLVTVALGTYLRAGGLSEMLFFGDEILSLCNTSLPWSELFRTFDEHGTGVPLLLLQKASAAIFGANELTLRLPALVPGALAVPAAFVFFRLFFGPFVSALTTLLFAVSHYAVYYSMVGRIYSLYLLLTILASILAIAMCRRTRYWHAAGLAVLFGTMLFCHLASAAFVALLSLYVLGALVARKANRRDYLAWALALAGGGTLALALYLPTLPTVVEFLTSKARFQEGWSVDLPRIVEILAGGRLNALLFALLVPGGIIAGLRRRRPHRLLVFWLLAMSPVLLAIVRPIGGPYARARYVIYLLPFLLVALTDALLAVSEGLSKLARGADRTRITGALLLCFAAVYWASGFEGLWIDRGANIDRLRTIGISEVDVDVPPLYAEVASEDACEQVIEFPFYRKHKRGSAQILYMRYRQVHGGDIYIGEAVDTGDMNRYVNVYDLPNELQGNSCLIVHKDVLHEVRGWSEKWPRKKRGAPAPHKMASRIRPACWFEDSGVIYNMQGIQKRLSEFYGPPWREDDSLAIYRNPRVRQPVSDDDAIE
jgi:hypothetical protein